VKEKYVFVGSNVADMRGVVQFRSFGQAAELSAEQARDLSVGGAAIVPAAEFDALGVTPEELRKFGAFGALEFAPAEFQQKRGAAIAAAEKFRAAAEKAEA
jgi:hypothetical protein